MIFNISKIFILFLFFIKFAFGIEQLDPGLFYAEKNGIYYVLEKVDSSNIDTWNSFILDQQKTYNKMNRSINKLFFTVKNIFNDEEKYDNFIENYSQYKKDYYLNLLENKKEEIKNYEDLVDIINKYIPIQEIILNNPDPTAKFKDCLKFYDRADAYVGYILDILPTGKFNMDIAPNLEMFVSMLTDQTAPFQLHMGIARGLRYLDENKEMHGGISVNLHAFMAKAMKEIIDQNKIYFITTPLKQMSEILKKSLSEENIKVGNNNENSPITTIGISPYDENYEFSLKDPQWNLIFHVNNKEDITKYWWFFSNTQPSSTHPYTIIELEKLASKF